MAGEIQKINAEMEARRQAILAEPVTRTEVPPRGLDLEPNTVIEDTYVGPKMGPEAVTARYDEASVLGRMMDESPDALSIYNLDRARQMQTEYAQNFPDSMQPDVPPSRQAPSSPEKTGAQSPKAAERQAARGEAPLAGPADPLPSRAENDPTDISIFRGGLKPMPKGESTAIKVAQVEAIADKTQAGPRTWNEVDLARQTKELSPFQRIMASRFANEPSEVRRMREANIQREIEAAGGKATVPPYAKTEILDPKNPPKAALKKVNSDHYEGGRFKVVREGQNDWAVLRNGEPVFYANDISDATKKINNLLKEELEEVINFRSLSQRSQWETGRVGMPEGEVPTRIADQMNIFGTPVGPEDLRKFGRGQHPLNIRGGSGKPPREPNTIVDPDYNQAPELGPEPVSIFHNADDASRATIGQIRSQINAKHDPRTVEPPLDSPVPDLPNGKVPLTQEIIEADAYMQQLVNSNRSTWEKFKKYFLLPEFRAQEAAVPIIRGLEAAKRIQDMRMGQVFPKLREVAKRLSKDHRKMLYAFTRQRTSPERILSGKEQVIPVSALPAEFRALFEEGMSQIRHYRDDLVKAGYFSPEQITKMQKLDELGVEWLHRDYLAFLDSSYMPNPGRRDRALHFLMKQGKMDAAGAANFLASILIGDGPPQQRWGRLVQNHQILKQKKHIPPVIQSFMGRIDDPAFVVAASMSEIERLWLHMNTTKAVVDTPGTRGTLWDDVPRMNLSVDPVPMDKKLYGEFAGKYLDPHIYETIMQAPSPKLHNGVVRFLNALSQIKKTTKVALSPVTYMVNYLGNSTYAAAAGLPVWHARFVPRINQSWKALAAYGNKFGRVGGAPTVTKRGKTNPYAGGFEADARWVEWALEDGALRPGMGMEFAGGSEARAIAERFLHQKRGDWVDMFTAGWDWANEKRAQLGTYYDKLDSNWRLAVYMEQVEKGVDRMKLSVPEARARASKIVNENFASAGTVGHGVRDLARHAGAVANPFLTFHTDNIRVHLNWIKSAGKAPGVGGLFSGHGASRAINVGLQYGLITAAAAGLRRMFNFSDQDVEQAEDSLRNSAKRFSPWREWLPWQDEKGRPQVINLSHIFPTMLFFEGDPQTPVSPVDKTGVHPDRLPNLLKRIMVNASLGTFAGTGHEDSMQRVMQAVGLSHEEAYRGQPPLPGNVKEELLRAIWREHLEPGLVRDARNVARRAQVAPWLPEDLGGGPLGKYEEPLSGLAALGAVSPVRLEPVGERSRAGELARRRAVEARLRGMNARVRQRGTFDQGDRDEALEALKNERIRNRTR